MFWGGKALAYHFTGLFNMQEGCFRMHKGIFSIDQSWKLTSSSSAHHLCDRMGVPRTLVLAILSKAGGVVG